MDKLILAIDGDIDGRVGPLAVHPNKKLATLSRIFGQVRAADRERGKALAEFPQLDRAGSGRLDALAFWPFFLHF